MLRRAVRQAKIQAQATGAGARSRVLIRRARGRRVLVGPWLAEVGFELLYWIPFARKLILGAGLPPDQVLVLSRGGVQDWYGDAFGRYLDLYDLFDPDELHLRQRQRIETTGGQKHTDLTDLDRDALRRAAHHLGEEPLVLHPSMMFRRFRPVWMRRRTTAAVLRDVSPAPIRPLPRPDGLPERYVAVKLYSSDCLPIDGSLAGQVTEGLSALTGDLPLVPLSAGMQVDDHTDLIRPEAATEPTRVASNLRDQTAVIQHADALVCTYGGFVYLGSLCGTPTLALYERPNFNFLHLDVLAHAWDQLPHGAAAPLSMIDVRQLAQSASDVASAPVVTYAFAPRSDKAPA
jgi:hypothetical protein